MILFFLDSEVMNVWIEKFNHDSKTLATKSPHEKKKYAFTQHIVVSISMSSRWALFSVNSFFVISHILLHRHCRSGLLSKRTSSTQILVWASSCNRTYCSRFSNVTLWVNLPFCLSFFAPKHLHAAFALPLCWMFCSAYYNVVVLPYCQEESLGCSLHQHDVQGIPHLWLNEGFQTIWGIGSMCT